MYGRIACFDGEDQGWDKLFDVYHKEHESY